MRLIDADALRRAMYHEAFETDSDMQKWDSGCWIRFKMIENAIEAQPTIEPVKQGRLEWRKEKTIWQTGYYCSECQAFFGKDYDMVKYFNYCPNCGARMSEGSEE